VVVRLAYRRDARVGGRLVAFSGVGVMAQEREMATWFRNLMDQQNADRAKAITERRMAVVYVSPELIVALAVGVKLRIDQNDVPPFPMLGRPVWYNTERQAFAVVIVDHSLRPIPDGEELPILQGPIYHRVEDET
jgi:hypothetical protein